MDQKQDTVEYTVRPARPDEMDAEGIAQAYNSVYEDYPFVSFTDPAMVQEEVIPGGDSENFVVEVAGGQMIDGEEVPEDTVVGTGSVKFHRGGHEAEFGGIVLDPDFQEMDGAPFYQNLVDQRVQVARNSDADRYVTHPVSSTHAKTQHGHAKKGAVPEGVSVNKYPEVFNGEGRETVVPMVYPDGNYEFTAGDSRDVFVTDDTVGLVDQVLSGVNEERDGEALSRDLHVGPEEVNAGYSVSEKVYDDEVGKMASYQLTPGGEQSIDEALDAVDQALEDEDVRWVGVEFDANDESAWEASQELSDRGFTPERYSPEAMNYGDEVSDALGFQYAKDGTGEIQLIDQAVETLDATGTEYQDRGNGPVDHVTNVSIS